MRITAFDPGRIASFARHDTTRPWEMSVGVIDQIGSGRLLRPSPLHIVDMVRDADCVIIEEVGARPKQGVSAVFTFGMCVGTILGAVGAMSKPTELVTSQKWKASSRLSGLSEDTAKDAARSYASQLYPDCHPQFRVKKNHGMAEAALMARWYFLDGAGQHAANSASTGKPAPEIVARGRSNGMRLASFDPGRAASYALCDASDADGVSMGEIEQIGIGRLTRPSPLHIAEILGGADAVLIEEVGARHEQGVSSVFTFGLCLGTILGAAGAMGLPIEMVTPQKWKKTSGIGKMEKDEAKEMARDIAQTLFPGCRDNLRLKKNHGMAEAGLMARWYFSDGPGKMIDLRGAQQMRRGPEPEAT